MKIFSILLTEVHSEDLVITKMSIGLIKHDSLLWLSHTHTQKEEFSEGYLKYSNR